MAKRGGVESIVIAGAGHAGGRAAEALRVCGFAGSITLIGAEKYPPYERPPLSKDMLFGEAQPKYIKPAAAWGDLLGVNLITGTHVLSCNIDQQSVTIDDGRTYSYDRLLVATGTQPKRLPQFPMSDSRIHYLRDIDDARRLRDRFRENIAVVAVGGGVVGLEAACAAVKLGCEVTVLECGASLLPRAFPKVVSAVVEEEHHRRGVKFEFNATVREATPRGVRLEDGQELKADLILVCVGVEPSDGIGRTAAFAGVAGIQIDACGRTCAPNVFCAGDAALQWSPWHNRFLRVETWANAQNQAVCVASNMVRDVREYRDPPWFWTDQYDLNIQVVGDLQDAELLVRGEPRSRSFSVAALRSGELVGAASVNASKEMAIFRRLVASRVRVDRGLIESPAYDLRQLLKAN